MSGRSPSGSFFGSLASWVQGKVDKSAAKADKRNARAAHFRDAAQIARIQGEEMRATETNRAGLFKDVLSHSAGLAKPGTKLDFDYSTPKISMTVAEPQPTPVASAAEKPKSARTPRAKAPAAAKPAKTPRTTSTKPKKASA